MFMVGIHFSAYLFKWNFLVDGIFKVDVTPTITERSTFTERHQIGLKTHSTILIFVHRKSEFGLSNSLYCILKELTSSERANPENGSSASSIPELRFHQFVPGSYTLSGIRKSMQCIH